MSAPARHAEHGLFHAEAALAQWQAAGARVLNGAPVLAIDRSKARQLALIASLGLPIPATRTAHRQEHLPDAAAEIGYPLLIKANSGGAGANIVRYDSEPELRAAIAAGTIPTSPDGVLLVQELIPARRNIVTRLETLAGRYLYAIDIDSDGGFDLCPADACVAQPGRAAVRMTRADPPTALIAAAERIATVANLDMGGIEVMTDDRDGSPRFYDINALSNFVANPMQVLGWDPHERLADTLETILSEHT